MYVLMDMEKRYLTRLIVRQCVGRVEWMGSY